MMKAASMLTPPASSRPLSSLLQSSEDDAGGVKHVLRTRTALCYFIAKEEKM